MAASNSRTLAMFLFIAIFANGMLSCAQEPIAAQDFATIPQATAAVLEQMTRAAGVIFAGEVVSVRRPAGDAGSGYAASEGVVVTEFRIEEAVRGCDSGSVYILREWAGLWTGGDRYRVGQRLLLFLRSPAASGLSTPVHGVEGAIPLRGGGIAPGPYDVSALAADRVVDLRWVEAQAMRGPPELEPPELKQTVLDSAGDPARRLVAAELAQPLRDLTTENTAPSGLPPVPHNGFPHWTALPRVNNRSMPSLAQVLSLCRQWSDARLDGAGARSDGFQ